MAFLNNASSCVWNNKVYLIYIIDLKEIMGEDPEDPRGLPLMPPNKEGPPCWVRVPAGSKACTLFRISKIRRHSPL